MEDQTDEGSPLSQVIRLPGRKVLLVANHNAVRRPYNGVQYEFINNIARLETATVIDSPARRYLEPILGDVAGDYAKVHTALVSRARRVVGLPAVARTRASRVMEEYDLCFFMCQFPRDLVEIDQVAHWRERSARACVFILETWPHALQKHRAELRILDRFDHVFVLNPASVATLKAYTSRPVSFLATGTDCLSCGVDATPTDRTIDVLSLGRRDRTLHDLLCEKAGQNGWFYYFDAWSMISRDWAESRRMSAELIRRSKYYLACDPAAIIGIKRDAVAGQTALSTRYFEGAAGGAILVGTRPNVAEFDQLFDWPDALVEVPGGPESILKVLGELEADPARRARISLANRVQSLRRHDWAYRWASVLETMGLERSLQLDRRIALLQAVAADTEARAETKRVPVRRQRSGRLAANLAEVTGLVARPAIDLGDPAV
jgi:hypothetical protein